MTRSSAVMRGSAEPSWRFSVAHVVVVCSRAVFFSAPRMAVAAERKLSGMSASLSKGVRAASG
ncbi:hypothetical protein ACFZDP_46345 [Streptomyces mirabilis]|uniref:hypothetical protein n=1 Tax=Streptomyces mirabilis TaxID=68239 RepID=UPI0036EAE291